MERKRRASTLEKTRPSLLGRLAAGRDEEAWWEFDRQYRLLILHYARAKGLQESDAEDVRQLVMMNLARSLSGFEYDPERGHFRSYLRTVIQNAVRQQFRRPKVETEGLSTHVDPAEADQGDEVWEREWQLHHYRLAMKTIRATFDPRSVSVFEELLKGSSVEGIAESNDMSGQAVHKVKQRIRKRLAELIAQQVREEGDIGL